MADSDFVLNQMESRGDESPEYILARACANWGNPPVWWGQNPDCSRERAEEKFRDFIQYVCANWGLVIVPIGAITEIEASHGG